MAEALCNGVVASPCGGDVGVAARTRGAATKAALAESLPLGGYATKSTFSAGRMSVSDRKPRPMSRSRLEVAAAAAPGQIQFPPAPRHGNLELCFSPTLPLPALEFLLPVEEEGSPVCAPLLQMKLSFPKAMRWWEKGLHPNMREVESAQDLADSLLNAGDKLVVVDFFSPGCGGCRALHPKIAQFAEKNPDVVFLQVNYETHKSMCYSLHVHVLPFFRFYRGADGRVSSFSCTNATIKKFKDALAKHGADRCSLGPARGLDESELMALAANRDLDFTYEKQNPGLVPLAKAIAMEAAAPGGPWLPLPASATQQLLAAGHGSDNNPFFSSGRYS